ncbi:MAG: hypothetical protein AAF756_10875 [Pseudomonadota bacterium]
MDKDLAQAVHTCLAALAVSDLKLNSDSPEDLREHTLRIGNAIRSYPQQFKGDDIRGPAAVPFNALAKVLAELLTRQQQDLRYQQAEADADRQWKLLLSASAEFFDPSYKDRHQANEAVVKALGFKSRRRSVNADYLEEFETLKSEGVSTTAAYKILGEKYHRDWTTIRNGIKRERIKRK